MWVGDLIQFPRFVNHGGHAGFITMISFTTGMATEDSHILRNIQTKVMGMLQTKVIFHIPMWHKPLQYSKVFYEIHSFHCQEHIQLDTLD